MKATKGHKWLIYALLALGAGLFCWPLVWMVGTSFMADRELFTQEMHFFPQRPLPREKSPYADSRAFSEPRGPRSRELLDLLEGHLGGLKGAWPGDMEPEELRRQLARGLLRRLAGLLPRESWKLPPEKLASQVLKTADPAMVEGVLKQVRRSLLMGQLRARSYDLKEDQLVAARDAGVAWKIESTADAHLLKVREEGQDWGELHYDFSRGGPVRLSRTFDLSFPVERLYRLQLYLRGDESWNPLNIYVEKQGKLYQAARSVPLGDANWTVLTWQEPGPDDRTNKIRTWIHLAQKDSGAAYESGPRRIKVVFELGQANALSAWWYKVRRNYQLVFDNMPFWRYAATSVALVMLNLVGTLLSCSLVAYAFARLRWPGRSMSFSLMLATLMVPAQVTMIPFFLIVRWLDWYNTLYPLWVGSFFASAFNVFLLHQFFKGIPKDLEDAAKIDGCGPVRIYWYIMLPLIKPALATIAIFTFMGVWNDFMGPLIYLSDQRLYPLPLGLYALNVQAGGSMSMMMAGSLLMILPVVLIFFLAQRYFIEGVTMTGLKG